MQLHRGMKIVKFFDLAGWSLIQNLRSQNHRRGDRSAPLSMKWRREWQMCLNPGMFGVWCLSHSIAGNWSCSSAIRTSFAPLSPSISAWETNSSVTPPTFADWVWTVSLEFIIDNSNSFLLASWCATSLFCHHWMRLPGATAVEVEDVQQQNCSLVGQKSGAVFDAELLVNEYQNIFPW